jgi:hypothetical protein
MAKDSNPGAVILLIIIGGVVFAIARKLGKWGFSRSADRVFGCALLLFFLA